MMVRKRIGRDGGPWVGEKFATGHSPSRGGQLGKFVGGELVGNAGTLVHAC